MAVGQVENSVTPAEAPEKKKAEITVTRDVALMVS